MFLIKKGSHDPKQTASEMAIELLEMMNDPEFIKFIKATKVTPADAAKLEAVMTKMVESQKYKIDLDKNSPLLFMLGMAYGTGLTHKLAEGFGNEPSVEQAMKRGAKLAYPYLALALLAKDWDSTHWLDNLIKKAKVAEAPKPKSKKTNDAKRKEK